MNSVQSLIRKINNLLFSETRHYLGRWRIDYCEKRLENKVSWTNEDHCGTCSRFKYPNITNNPNIQEYISINQKSKTNNN